MFSKRAQRRELKGTDALKRPDQRGAALAAILASAPPGTSEAIKEQFPNLYGNTKERESMAELKDICGAWKRQPKNGGRAYYSGKVEREIVIPAGSYLNVFQNPDANEENKKPQLKIAFSEPG